MGAAARAVAAIDFACLPIPLISRRETAFLLNMAKQTKVEANLNRRF